MCPLDGPGEARIRGPCLFREYFGNPEATRAAFDDEGYFLTGDIVQRIDGAWKILGRNRWVIIIINMRMPVQLNSFTHVRVLLILTDLGILAQSNLRR
jgi:acyl-CoA synthetase (AMP-forming)/AMP-acid ligase II